MVKLRILNFFLLFNILHNPENVDAARKQEVISKVCLTTECQDAATIIRESMDTKVAPCDDFYKFACGNFVKNEKIRKDEMFIDRDNYLEKKLLEQLKSSLEELIQHNEPRFITVTKNFYKACINTTAIKKNGLNTILGDFQFFGGWPVLVPGLWNEKNFDWKHLNYNMRKLGYNTDTLFYLSVYPDLKNSKKRALNIDQPEFPIDREYLVKGYNNTIVTAYYKYMVDIAVDFGANRDRAINELKESLNFEMKLANITLKDEDRRNGTAAYNPITVEDLSNKYPSIKWKEYFNSLLSVHNSSMAIGDKEVIIVNAPPFFDEFEKLMNETQKKVLANYLFWRAAQSRLTYLTDEVRNHKLKFTSLLNGQTEMKERWKECVEITAELLKLSIGALYMRKYFTPKSKKSAEELAVDIKQQLKKILKEVDWMDDKTRASALDKLESMKMFIGYPDQLLDLENLDEFYRKLEITSNDYLRAASKIIIFITDYSFDQLRMPVETSAWTNHGAVAVINAAYYVQDNSIEVLAGILQGIYFGENRPQYLNYAGVGTFIMGHEITHAFDDLGSQFDKNGNLKNWWTPVTKQKFLQKAACIIQQYGNYTDEEVGLKLNGKQTQGENIADNGGAKLAYLAYQDWVKRNGPEPKLPGFDYSPSQLFWIQAAMQHCTKYTKEYLKNIISIDEHSPSEFRIIGSFSNRQEFARDFNCSLGSKMNPVKKCSVW